MAQWSKDKGWKKCQIAWEKRRMADGTIECNKLVLDKRNMHVKWGKMSQDHSGQEQHKTGYGTRSDLKTERIQVALQTCRWSGAHSHHRPGQSNASKIAEHRVIGPPVRDGELAPDQVGI
ncbi:hypothetical protein TRVL_01919 [Trypanosoma vivax]|nr:hypothetical protein TRVL_01919 [Trypanosoma vivax]